MKNVMQLVGIVLSLVVFGSACASKPKRIYTEGDFKRYQETGLYPWETEETRANRFQEPKMSPDVLAPLERLGTQWQARQPAQQPTQGGCRQESLRDPATGLFKQYRVCD